MPGLWNNIVYHQAITEGLKQGRVASSGDRAMNIGSLIRNQLRKLNDIARANPERATFIGIIVVQFAIILILWAG